MPQAGPFAALLTALIGAVVAPLAAQDPSVRLGGEIPAEVDTIYERGLAYLSRT